MFKNAFIPQKLADIDHYEREIIKMSSTGNNTGCARIVVDSHPYPVMGASCQVNKTVLLLTTRRVFGWVGSPRRTATSAAYDDLLDPGSTGDANDDDFMYKKIVGLDPANKTSRLEPELLAQQKPTEPRKLVVEFNEPGKLGVSFDREDADLRVVEVAEVGLAAQEGSIRPGMQLYAVESAALGGLVQLAGLGYTEALTTVAKAGRPMALTFLCDDEETDESDDQEDEEGDEWKEREVLHDGTGRPTEAVKAAKKANQKAVKEVSRLIPLRRACSLDCESNPCNFDTGKPPQAHG